MLRAAWWGLLRGVLIGIIKMVPSLHFVIRLVVSTRSVAAAGCAGTPLGGRVAERLSNKQIFNF